MYNSVMRFAASVALIILASGPALAGVSPSAPSPSTGTAPAPSEVSTAAFAWRSTAPLTLEAVLSQFELFDRELNTLSARFSQSLKVPETGMSSAIEGALSYRKPERLRIEYSRPEPQTVVSDGRDIWLHRPSQGQAIQSSLKDWKDSDPLISNLMQFGSYGKMLTAYAVSLETSTGSAPALMLRPKDARSPRFELRLILDAESLFPGRTLLLVDSMRVETKLDELRFNPPLDAKLFDFEPPPGVDVFRGFKPPKYAP